MALPPFQRVVDAHAADVARLARALVGPDDADDVAQQAWAQALAAYPSLRSGAGVRAWLMTITARCATDVHRARARRPVPVEQLPELPAPPSPEPGDPALWAAVAALPPRQRTAVVLRYVADLDHAAVATALDTTPAATRRLVSDALTTLRGTR